jgi:hypothetical protein
MFSRAMVITCNTPKRLALLAIREMMNKHSEISLKITKIKLPMSYSKR